MVGSARESLCDEVACEVRGVVSMSSATIGDGDVAGVGYMGVAAGEDSLLLVVEQMPLSWRWRELSSRQQSVT